MAVATPQDKGRANQQDDQRHQAHCDHPAQVRCRHHQHVQHRQGQPDDRGDAQRDTFEFETVLKHMRTIFTLESAGKTQPPKPQAQLLGIRARTNLVVPGVIVRHPHLVIWRPAHTLALRSKCRQNQAAKFHRGHLDLELGLQRRTHAVEHRFVDPPGEQRGNLADRR